MDVCNKIMDKSLGRRGPDDNFEAPIREACLF